MRHSLNNGRMLQDQTPSVEMDLEVHRMNRDCGFPFASRTKKLSHIRWTETRPRERLQQPRRQDVPASAITR
jgi:hypothetical protein